MGVKFTQMPNYSRLKQEFRAQVVKEMESVVIDNKEEIVTRTGQGVDYKGAAFPAYTKQYQKWKASKGRNVSRPDMRFSGRMLQSLQTQVVQVGTKIVGRIFPASNLDALKVRGNNRFREFFAVSDKSRKKFGERMSSLFGRIK